MTATKLLPCPFCGGEAATDRSLMSGPPGSPWSAACDRRMSDGTWDGCVTLEWFATAADAITAWNTRATPDVAGLLDALGAIIARWDTPAWKDAGPTGDVINQGRAELAKWGR